MRLVSLIIVIMLGVCEVESKESIPTRLPIDAPEAFVEQRAELLAKIKAGELSSVAISVIDDGEVIWREVLGSAKLQENEPARIDHTYALGSLAKSITATTIMTMVQDGLLNLDTPADEYPDIELISIVDGRAPTVRELLQMTGGISHGHFSTPPSKGNPKVFLKLYALQSFPAGENFLYSNYSFGLLSGIASSVIGKPFAQIVSERVFQPLEMHTARAGAYGTEPQDATLYASDKTVINPYEWHPYAAGGMAASLLDLEQYALFHMGRLGNKDHVLTAESLELMHTDRPKQIEEGTIALGIGSIQLDDGTLWLLTNGSVQGGMSHLSMLPSMGDAVIVLMNLSGDSDIVDYRGAKIADVLNPGFLDAIIPFIESYGAVHYGPFTGQSPYSGAWCGTFSANNSATIAARFSFSDDGAAVLSVRDQDAIETEPTMDGLLMSGSIMTSEERVKFNLLPDDDRLVGFLITTSSTDALANDLPHAGHLAKCE